MHYPEMWGFVQFLNKIAGRGEDQYIQKSIEAGKWTLRLVYYSERNYYIKNSTYTDDLKALGLNEYKIEGFRWPPEITYTKHLFEARLIRSDGTDTLTIYQDGLVK